MDRTLQTRLDVSGSKTPENRLSTVTMVAKKTRVMALLATMGVLMGCSDFTAVTPHPLVSFEPPTLYRAWYAEVEQCSGEIGRFERIEWFRTPEIMHPETGQPVAGVQRDPHTIILAEPWVNHRGVVAHEMLHDLINDHSHKDPRWNSCAPTP